MKGDLLLLIQKTGPLLISVLDIVAGYDYRGRTVRTVINNRTTDIYSYDHFISFQTIKPYFYPTIKVRLLILSRFSLDFVVFMALLQMRLPVWCKGDECAHWKVPAQKPGKQWYNLRTNTSNNPGANGDLEQSKSMVSLTQNRNYNPLGTEYALNYAVPMYQCIGSAC